MGFSKLVKGLTRRRTAQATLGRTKDLALDEPQTKTSDRSQKEKIAPQRKVTVRFAKDVLVTRYDPEDEEKSGQSWIRREDENEYVRESAFYKKVSKWAVRSELASELYESDEISMFLSRSRIIRAKELGLELYTDLVKKCGKFVNKRMYAPSVDELHKIGVRSQTEEILTSLVADYLLDLFEYNLSDAEEQDCLYHDSFHISRSISWRRQTYIEKHCTEE